MKIKATTDIDISSSELKRLVLQYLADTFMVGGNYVWKNGKLYIVRTGNPNGDEYLEEQYHFPKYTDITKAAELIYSTINKTGRR